MRRRCKMDYPIAEIFHSLQGEGAYVGVPMCFVRLAGCPVGGATGACTSFDRQSFQCDTDYSKRYVLDEQKLVTQVREQHLCITGGEPLIHNLQPLIDEATRRFKYTHLETSDTIPLPEWMTTSEVYVACSPKRGFKPSNLRYIHELRFLVGPSFDEHSVAKMLQHTDCHCRVYISPINDGPIINNDNLKRCLALLQAHPEWVLNVQLHKYLNLP